MINMKEWILLGIVVIALVFVSGCVQESEQDAKTLVTQECTIDRLQYRLEQSCRDAFENADDPDVCELMEKYSDICYSYYAEKLSDTSLCENTGFIVEKDECLLPIALKQKNITLCKEIDEANRYPYFLGADCYSRIGISLNNVSICEYIQEKNPPYDLYNRNIVQEKNTCFYKIAMNTNNSSLCNKFEDPEIIDTGNYLESKSFCYFKIALKTKNSSLCNNVNTITVQEITPDPNAPPCVGAGACASPVIRFNWTMSENVCNNEINDIYLDLTCPEEAPNCTYDIYNNLRSDYI